MLNHEQLLVLTRTDDVSEWTAGTAATAVPA